MRPYALICRTGFWLIFASLLPMTVTAAELELGGSLKSLDLYGEAGPAGLYPEYWLSSNRLRLEATWPATEQLQVEAALDSQLRGSDPAGLFPLTTASINRHVDLEKQWQHGSTWESALQVDRLNLRYDGGRIDATLGRQAIGFGRILIVAPLDVIAPFPPDAIDTDVRPGVDAMHLTGHYGLDGQVAATLVWGDIARHDSALLTWVDNRAGIDLLAIGGRLRDRPMAGFGLAGSLGPLGLKGELAVYQGQRVGRIGGDLHDDFAIGAVETWYRFDNGLTLVTEYLYNGPGVNRPQAYPRALASAPLTEGLTYLLGRHYLLVAPSYELHPLVELQGLLMWNLDDHSTLTRPTLAFSLADNLALEVFWIFNQGRKPQPTGPGGPPLPESEFGWRGDSGGLFLKYYF